MKIFNRGAQVKVVDDEFRHSHIQANAMYETPVHSRVIAKAGTQGEVVGHYTDGEVVIDTARGRVSIDEDNLREIV